MTSLPKAKRENLRSLPKEKLPPQKIGGRSNLSRKRENDHWAKNDTLIKPRFQNKAGQPVLLQPLFKEPHPYPFVKTSDVYLLSTKNEDEQTPHPPLKEDVVEKFIFDTPFANGFLEELLLILIEPEVREIVLTFTVRQGPANKPSTPDMVTTLLQYAKPTQTSVKKLESTTEDVIADNIIMEVVKDGLTPILWHCLDERSVFLENSKYKQILTNDRGYTIPPQLIPKLRQHCTRIAQGIKTKKWPSEYADFKGIPTKNYIYNLHKLWNEQMSNGNFATDQLRLQIMNEAIWHHFFKETIESAKISAKNIDMEELKANKRLDSK